MITALLIGVCVGLLLGLTGAGGSIIAVPMLMYFYGWSVSEAAPVALLAVGLSAAVGALAAWKRAYLRYRAATLMGVLGIISAPLGIYIGSVTPDQIMRAVFSLTLCFVALKMIWASYSGVTSIKVMRANVAGDGDSDNGKIKSCRQDPFTGRLIWNKASAAAMAFTGVLGGLTSGLLGVGGGFVLVPRLRAISTLSMQSAVATSLMTIAIISLGTAVYGAATAGSYPFKIAIPFAIAAIIGMLIAGRLASKINSEKLQIAFAIFALIVGVSMWFPHA